MDDRDFVDALEEQLEWEKAGIRLFIETEARANNMGDLFQNMEEEQWDFIVDLLWRYNKSH